MVRFNPKFIATILLLLLVAAQCQATAPPDASPAPQPPTPAPILILPVQPGDGTDAMDQLLETGVLRVGIRVWPEANFAPPAFRGFSNAETGGALNGFEVDIARLLAAGLGLELELIEAPPLVIAGGEWRGEWDVALASLTPFDQPLQGMSAQKMAYSQPYGYLPMGVLIPVSGDNIQTLEDLSGQRVGVLEHTAYQRLLTPAEGPLTVQGQLLIPPPPPDVRLVVLSNLPKAIRRLGRPKLENGPPLAAIFGPTPILEQAIRSDLPVKLVPEAGHVGAQPLAIAAVPQNGLKIERLVLEINKVLARLQRQGDLAEVYFRWYGQDFSRPP